MSWSATNSALNMTVKLPMLTAGTIRDRLYGIADMGDVPSCILVVSATPKEVSTSPAPNSA